MTVADDSGPGRLPPTLPVDRIIDLTNAAPVVAAAKLAVEELQSVLGGGPWCITDRATGEVLATTGSLGAAPVRTIALAAPGLDLVAMDDGSPAGTGTAVIAPTIDRIGRLLGAVVEAEERAAEAARQVLEVEARARVDSLTGLLDQGEWWRRVDELEAQLHRHPRDVAVVVIDLDGLKATNDTRGHLHGDLLIRLAASTLTSVVRSGDLLARVGGDEFAVLAVDHEVTADGLASRIAKALDSAGIAASVGARVHRSGTTLRVTYAAADSAMYAEKRRRSRRRNHPNGL